MMRALAFSGLAAAVPAVLTVAVAGACAVVLVGCADGAAPSGQEGEGEGEGEGESGPPLLVVAGVFDSAEPALLGLGFERIDVIDGAAASWTTEAFADLTALSAYQGVFVGCGVEEAALITGLDSGERDNLRSYVQQGGALFVSDWSYDLIELLWPDQINFLGDDLANSAAEQGIAGTYSFAVADPDLALSLAQESIDLSFTVGNFALATDVADGVTRYLVGDMDVNETDGSSKLTDAPLAVGFSDGLGRVLFSTFHQERDDGGTEEELTPAEDLVLRSLILSQL